MVFSLKRRPSPILKELIHDKKPSSWESFAPPPETARWKATGITARWKAFFSRKYVVSGEVLERNESKVTGDHPVPWFARWDCFSSHSDLSVFFKAVYAIWLHSRLNAFFESCIGINITSFGCVPMNAYETVQWMQHRPTKR